MGTDIRAYAEKKRDDGTWEIVDSGAFDWRSYGMYGFFADIRNYSAVPPLSAVRGLPKDASADLRTESADGDGFGHSWLSIDELTAFDYDQTFEDRRTTVQTGPNSWDGGRTAEPGGGELKTYRAFLGDGFFRELQRLKDLGAERVVFWFD